MALEKPFIHSLTAEGTPDPVNFNDVFTFAKDDPVSLQATKSTFNIIFIRDENSVGPSEIIWKYKNACDRNSEYDLILKLISKPIQ